ncbi:putative transposase (putative), gypsy type [Medicago truncatula]|uniref:Putative transposase (Putative), gypsy type n=1 Tax=Medicago truncatula TaxID=3880 RepID=A0A396IRS7_MEDTR|nr:putative transposase (putative), gypsy type [Medicago truncatula]
MYVVVLEEFGVKVPFTRFEMDVLKFLNVAPSQIQPNSWAFIKCFEILCEALGVESCKLQRTQLLSWRVVMMNLYERGIVEFLHSMSLTDIHQLWNKEGDSESLELYLLPMLPMTRAERRKYFAYLKAKKEITGYVTSDPAGAIASYGHNSHVNCALSKLGFWSFIWLLKVSRS